MVNRQQLFDLKKSWENCNSVGPGTKFDPNLSKPKKPKTCHPYGTKPKTKATPVSSNSLETDMQNVLREIFVPGQWVGNLVGAIKDATVVV